MSQVVLIEVAKLRKSIYNPRMVHDPGKMKILVESVSREGVKQPLLVFPAGDEAYEVLDGSRRLEAARQAGANKVPCIVVEASEAPRTSLYIHFSQDDLAEEELVLYVERLVADEVFRSVDEVCRFLGVSKTWFYALKKAAKLRSSAKEASATTLAMVEKTDIDEEKKKQVLDTLDVYPLPRTLLKQALREIEEKPDQQPATVFEKYYWSTPRKTDESTVSASGFYNYVLRRTTSGAEFMARRESEIVWRVEIPTRDIEIVKMLWQKL